MKTIVIGVDGATFNLLDGWLESGELPGLASFTKNGSYGVLNSVAPYVTPSTWTAFSTAKTAGKNNLFDFYRLNENYQYQLNSSRHKKSKEIWDYLPGKSLLLNVPMTYPPKSINGSMVTGMLTPGTSAKFTYPVKLKEEILKFLPEYKIEMNNDMYKGQEEKFFAELYRMTSDRVKLFSNFLHKKEWDFFYGVFTGTDRMQHFIWDKDVLLDYYKLIDSFILKVVEEYAESTNIFVVSDHGFAKVNKVFAVNSWLQKRGYLQQKEGSLLTRFLSTLNINRNSVIKTLQKLPIDITSLAVKLPTKLKMALPQSDKSLLLNTDWNNTKAFMTSFGQIYFNRTGRFSKGFLSKDECVKLSKEISHCLRKITYNGKKVIKSIKSNDELFNGQYSDQGPDMIIEMENGFSTQSKFSEDVFLTTDLKADHASEGILFCQGPDIKLNSYPNYSLNLMDLGATILHINGISVPGLDGKVCLDFLKNDISTKVSTEKEKLDSILDTIEI